MKNYLINLLLLLMAVTGSAICYGQQLNYATNTVGNAMPDEIKIPAAKNITADHKMATGIQCNANTFFNFGNTGVESYTITGGTVVSLGTVATYPPGYALATSNNLNGGSFTPTLYSSDPTLHFPTYYDGSTWITTLDSTPLSILNGAGNGNFLYFLQNGAPPGYVFSYNGSAFDTLYTLNPDFFAVADIAVDDSGNAWAFTGQMQSSAQNIIVVSPTGVLLKQYPVNFNSNNAYGCFMMNSTLYVGFGSGNTVYPNSYLPFTFTSTTANMGTPISNPFGSGADLASCVGGAPLSIKENSFENSFSVFPNPANEALIISFDHLIKTATLQVMDLSGRKISTKEIKSSLTETVNTSAFSNGIYFVEVLSGAVSVKKKFVVMH